jgi:hypothetical protein
MAVEMLDSFKRRPEIKEFLENLRDRHRDPGQEDIADFPDSQTDLQGERRFAFLTSQGISQLTSLLIHSSRRARVSICPCILGDVVSDSSNSKRSNLPSHSCSPLRSSQYARSPSRRSYLEQLFQRRHHAKAQIRQGLARARGQSAED